MGKKSNKADIIGKILIAILLIAIIAVLATAFVFKSSDSAPSIFGKSFYMMNGDGMEPYIPDGSVVVVKNGTLGNDPLYKVALCNIVDGELRTVLRVYHVDQKDGADVYLMKSDSSPDTQMITVPEDKIIGEAVQYSVFWGKAISFITSRTGILILVILPAIIIVVIELLHILRKVNNDDEDDEDNYSSDEKEQTADDEETEEPEQEYVPEKPQVVKVSVNNEGEAEYNKGVTPTADAKDLDRILNTHVNNEPLKVHHTQQRRDFSFKASPDDLNKVARPVEAKPEEIKTESIPKSPFIAPAGKKQPVKRNSSNQTLEELMKMLDSESKKYK